MGQLRQPLDHQLPGPAPLAQQPVEAKVARLTGQQIAVESPQAGVGAVVGQQGQTLMAAGLYQARHQEAIQHPLGLLAAHLPGQTGAIGRRRQGPHGDATPLQQRQHQLEVFQLLSRQGAEHRGQLAIARIAEHQLQRRPSRLALAVGMVEQQQLRMGEGLLQPGATGGGRQPLDPRLGRFRRIRCRSIRCRSARSGRARFKSARFQGGEFQSGCWLSGCWLRSYWVSGYWLHRQGAKGELEKSLKKAAQRQWATAGSKGNGQRQWAEPGSKGSSTALLKARSQRARRRRDCSKALLRCCRLAQPA